VSDVEDVEAVVAVGDEDVVLVADFVGGDAEEVVAGLAVGADFL
jgi:hypothetical protein